MKEVIVVITEEKEVLVSKADISLMECSRPMRQWKIVELARVKD